MKCSAIYIDGKWMDVYKDPIDQPEKTSKKGRFTINKRSDGVYVTSTAITYDILHDEFLQVVWKNGELIRDQTFAEIRALAV
jgi:nicotinamide phosphoribosyltransferase